MYLDWFIGTMKKTFNIEVKREDVGYEAHDFYHEEIDDLLIPAEHLEKLPNPLLIETLSMWMIKDTSRLLVTCWKMEQEKKCTKFGLRMGNKLLTRFMLTKRDSRHFLLQSYDKTIRIRIVFSRTDERQRFRMIFV